MTREAKFAHNFFKKLQKSTQQGLGLDIEKELALEYAKELKQIVAEQDQKNANRQIKDGVFRLLFEDPEMAAELY